jgi:hypothetical protein
MNMLRSAGAVLLALGAVCSAGLVGTLSTPDNEGLIAVGDWQDVNGGLTISWIISQNTDGTWHYQYTFSDGDGDVLSKRVSHFIISVSDNLTYADVYNFSSDVAKVTIDDFEEANGNPGFPAGQSLYGLKMDMTGNQVVAEFDSVRMPMWGDVYLKDGKNGSGGGIKFNSAYNADFGVVVDNLHDYMGTPVDADGKTLYKILVPDTIPEPATMVILGLGGAAMLLNRKRRA